MDLMYISILPFIPFIINTTSLNLSTRVTAKFMTTDSLVLMQLCRLLLLSCWLTLLWSFWFTHLGVLSRSRLIISLHKHVGNLEKSLLYMLRSFSTSLDVLDFSMLLQKHLNLSRRNSPTICKVAFITHQQNLRLRRTRIFDLSVPVISSVFKRLLISDVKDYHQSMRSSIIWTSDRAKSFVTSRVPNLKLDFVTVQGKRLKSEIHPDRSQEDLAEFIVSITNNDRWFTNTRVAHQNYLEEIMVLSLTLQHLKSAIIIDYNQREDSWWKLKK